MPDVKANITEITETWGNSNHDWHPSTEGNVLRRGGVALFNSCPMMWIRSLWSHWIHSVDLGLWWHLATGAFPMPGWGEVTEDLASLTPWQRSGGSRVLAPMHPPASVLSWLIAACGLKRMLTAAVD